jgi:hypothetical protein
MTALVDTEQCSVTLSGCLGTFLYEYYYSTNTNCVRKGVQWFGVTLSAFFLFVYAFYLQSAQVYSANCVKSYTMACTRGLSSALL